MTKLNSLGFNKKPEDTLVVVAMSGGVDSSTVAAMMKNEGYKVIGITLKLYNDTQQTTQSKQCCAGQDIMDAKRVADKLNIEHRILYYQNKFKVGVIDNFVESYLNGETPIPCVQCNQTVKFTDLFEEAKNLNADALITGHYVKSVTENGINQMYRGKDSNRDQSYFLFNTTREQLDYLRFPLGGMLKDETRKIAKNLDLNSIEQIIIIPRHIHFSSKLKTMMKSFYSNKIFIIEKFGENDVAYENSKLTFMGGSLFEHGGQNPIEPLSKGCFVLSGQYINNFSEIYADLEDLSLAKVFNEKNNQEIGSAINKYIDMNLDNEANIKNYFNLNIKQLSSIINKVEEC